MNFVIGAYPRCGTAWVSTMLNLHTGVLCLHDALEYVEASYLHSAEKFNGYKFVGDASSAACLIDWPKETTRVFIHRPVGDVMNSMDKCGVGKLFKDISPIVDKWSGSARFHFQFNNIFTGTAEDRLKVCKAILAICCPNIPFERDKVLNLLRHNVKLQRYDADMYDPETINRRLKGTQWAQ
jgi:hypothetical protein